MIVAGTLSACTPAPEATPTATALFSSDEEAFRAAEETYRAYTEAENDERRGGSGDPQEFLIGAALEGYIDAQRYLDRSGLTLEGDVIVTRFDGIPGSMTDRGKTLMATVCLDLTETTAHSDPGVETPDRPAIIAQRVEMTWVGHSYRISGELDEDN